MNGSQKNLPEGILRSLLRSNSLFPFSHFGHILTFYYIGARIHQMARECIDNCQIIKGVVGENEFNNFLSGPLSIHPDFFSDDDSEISQLLQVCKASYDCRGPRNVLVEKEEGIFFPKKVTKM